MPGCSSAAVPRSCLTSRSLWRQDRTFPRSPLQASSRKACGWPPRPGEVLCRGRTALGQTPGAVTRVRHDIAVQWRLISLSPAGFLFTSPICCLLPPGCKSITAPILLGGDAEPWARRGGLFGELQVRARARLWGCRAPAAAGELGSQLLLPALPLGHGKAEVPWASVPWLQLLRLRVPQGDPPPAASGQALEPGQPAPCWAVSLPGSAARGEQL